MWKYKITIYSWSNIGASVALIHYKNYRIGVEMPMAKVAYDRRLQRAITMYYFKESCNAYAMWEVLKYVGKKWNFDSQLICYDWNENKVTKLGEQSYHNNENE